MLVFNLPEKCKHFIGPAVRKGVTYPILGGTCTLLPDGTYKDDENGKFKIYEFRFHSEWSKTRICSIIKNPSDFQVLAGLVPIHLLHETMLQHGAFLHRDPAYGFNLSQDLRIDNWKFFVNPKKSKKLGDPDDTVRDLFYQYTVKVTTMKLKLNR
jgi:hypothetical protein